jgi:tetratricopeptide (TPR) repeat protein
LTLLKHLKEECEIRRYGKRYWLHELTAALHFRLLISAICTRARKINDRQGEADALLNIGGLYRDMVEKQKALDYFLKALPMLHTIGNKKGEASTISNIERYMIS